MVLTTPVKTGRARGGWTASIGASVDGPLHRLDPRGPPTINAIKRVTLRFKPGMDLYISNGVPYIGILNRNRDMLGRATRAAITLLRRFKYLEGF